MKKKMSVFSSCIISLFLAVFLSPANSHAITITPFTDWTLTINAKVINPVGEQPPPAGRAEAKRAFGPDGDNDAISAANLTADPLVIKASAKVTNTEDRLEGVNASTSLNFSRIYKTKNPLSSGSFTVNARGVKGIEGQLITQNPFFHPFALMDLQIDITEVDSTGVPLFPGPFAPVVKINPLLRTVDTLGPFAWVGDPGAAGRRTLDIKTNFSGKLKFKKKVNETKFFKVEGVFGVGASISKVDSLADRLTYLDAFFALVEENNPANVLSPQELLANLSLFLEIDGANKGTLTALGAEGFAISDFFGTVDIIVDATDVVPEPSTMLLLGFGLAGLGFMRRRFQYHCHWHSSQ